MAGKSNDEIAKALANLAHEQPDSAAPAREEHAEIATSRRQRPARPIANDAATSDPAQSSTAKAASAGDRGLELKRTLIPILLCTGAALLLGSGLCFTLGEESPIEGAGVLILMAALGAAILLTAAATMLQVRHVVSSSAKD